MNETEELVARRSRSGAMFAAWLILAVFQALIGGFLNLAGLEVCSGGSFLFAAVNLHHYIWLEGDGSDTNAKKGER